MHSSIPFFRWRHERFFGFFARGDHFSGVELHLKSNKIRTFFKGLSGIAAAGPLPDRPGRQKKKTNFHLKFGDCFIKISIGYLQPTASPGFGFRSSLVTMSLLVRRVDAP
jgi:hypothetical protein